MYKEASSREILFNYTDPKDFEGAVTLPAEGMDVDAERNHYCSLALSITTQCWNELGLGTNPQTAASSDMGIMIDRMLSLLLIKIVIMVISRQGYLEQYTDLSTQKILRRIKQRRLTWPPSVSPLIISQLREYVTRVVVQYRSVHYHNSEHAYHVFVSTNKLLEMMLYEGNNSKRDKLRPTFGIRSDPLIHFALLFSALVHDVDHQGVGNRQLVLESDELAILYNDQSVAEQRSLAVAFSELRKSEFQELRKILFPEIDDYQHFRKTVINLVLSTDIGSPERMQIVKSKWKEAFGETSEALERKAKRQHRRSSMTHSVTNGASGDTDEEPKSHFSKSVVTVGVNVPNIFPPGKSGGIRMQEPNAVPSVEEEDDDSDEDELTGSATPESSEDEAELEDSFNKDEEIVQRTFNERGGGYGSLSINAVPEKITKNEVSFDSNIKPTAPARPGVTRSGEKSIRDFSLVPDNSPTSRSPMALMHMSMPRGAFGAAPMRPAMTRRFSAPALPKMKPKEYRLGIRRALDFAGQAHEEYSAKPPRTKSIAPGKFSPGMKPFDDEVDPLKASVVLEQVLRAADVAPLMQSWDLMEKFSGRLFFELKSACKKDRGPDPESGWYDNQLVFIDSYVLPLARRLGDMGVFGEEGGDFVRFVKKNRMDWLAKGLTSSTEISDDWVEKHGNL